MADDQKKAEDAAVKEQAKERNDVPKDPGQDPATKSAQQATDLAGEAMARSAGASAPVAAAGGAREAADARADAHAAADAQARGASADEQAKVTDRRDGHKNPHAGKTFTALHPIERDGKPVHVGDSVKFEDHEEGHVNDLLELRVIVEGKLGDEKVDRALGEADLARGSAAALAG